MMALEELFSDWSASHRLWPSRSPNVNLHDYFIGFMYKAHIFPMNNDIQRQIATISRQDRLWVKKYFH